MKPVFFVSFPGKKKKKRIKETQSVTQLTYESHYSVYTAACLYSQSLTCLLGFSCVPEIYLSLTQDVLFTCMTRLNIKQDCTKIRHLLALISVWNICVLYIDLWRNKNDLKDPKNQTEGPVMLIFWSFACRLTIIELPQSNTSNLKIVIKKKKHFWPQKCLWMCLFLFFYIL